MNKYPPLTSLKTWFKNVNWVLLAFLVLVLDVKTVVKVAAVILIYLLRPDFRFGFRLKSFRQSRLPVFYYCMTLIVVLDWLFRHAFSLSQDLLMLNGLFGWVMCILILHQLMLFADKGDPAVIHRTVTLFFLLNIILSAGRLGTIMVETGSLNPYRWTGLGQMYFISTGDYIKGITFDFSLTNALINAMGILYFIRRKQFAMVIACTGILVMTGSNFTDLLIVVILIFLFFYRSSVTQKIVTASCLLIIGFFLKVVSPENKSYAEATLATIAKHETITLAAEDTNFHVSIKEVVLEKKVETVVGGHLFEPTPEQSKLPGKVISCQQTVQFLLAHPRDIPLGDGAGHFSSKLAFRASAVGIDGGYPARFAYVDSDFVENHLALFTYYFTKGNKYHSIVNTPFSVYNQIVGEYGLVGLGALAFFYFGFFLRRSAKGLYPWILVGILAAALATDYWFEQLSVVILFEFLWLIEFRQKKESLPK